MQRHMFAAKCWVTGWLCLVVPAGAATPYLVKDINLGSDGSSLTSRRRPSPRNSHLLMKYVG